MTVKTVLKYPDDDGPYEKVFQSECDCGWLGTVHYLRNGADLDADEHSATHHKDHDD